MAEIVVRSKLVEGFRSVVDNSRGHSIVLDLPKEKEGADTGATALELVVMALAGCISTIYALIAKKMRIKIDDLEVLVKAEHPQGELTVTKAEVNIRVKSKAPIEVLNKIMNLTMKNCPVGVLFSKAGVELKINLEKQ